MIMNKLEKQLIKEYLIAFSLGFNFAIEYFNINTKRIPVEEFIKVVEMSDIEIMKEAKENAKRLGVTLEEYLKKLEEDIKDVEKSLIKEPLDEGTVNKIRDILFKIIIHFEYLTELN